MKKLGIMFRATSIVAMVSALVVGATFAITRTAAVDNNTYTTQSNTDNGELLVSKHKFGPYSQEIQGFDFETEGPGEDCTEFERLFLKNTTDEDLDVTVTGDYEDEDIDEDEVYVKFVNKSTDDEVRYSLGQLQGDDFDELLGMPNISEHEFPDDLPGDFLEAGEKQGFKVCVELGEDAVDEGEELPEGAAFDLAFTGNSENGDDGENGEDED